MKNQRNIFKEEAYELLTELESALMELEETPADADLVARVFRAMHTIKGSGAMFGFDAVAAFTHEVETTFDLVRDGRLAVTPELINLGLTARDHIKVLLDTDETASEAERAKERDIMEGFKALRQTGSTDYENNEGLFEEALSDSFEEEAYDQGSETTYRIRFKPHRGIFANGTNPALLLDELRELGRCHVVAQFDDIPFLDSIDPEACHLFWDILLATDKEINAIKDVFIFVEDDCDLSIDAIDDSYHPNEEYKKLGQILVERRDVKSEDLARILKNQKRLGSLLVEAGLADSRAVESALLEQELVNKRRKQRSQAQTASSIRVSAKKLDILMDLVGELVTVQARLSQKAASGKDGELLAISEEVERLASELRDNAMSIRMLPIGTTFSKFKRMVHDLSKDMGKEVVMTTAGGETELDKTVIEQLSDPLVHIVRNCIDHGIEFTGTRQAAGKPEAGTINLAAIHAGTDVVIKISDDGAGLNAEKIRAKAIEKGLIAPEAELGEQEIYQLIFTPGFSTASEVSGISGRGVGMDVVKQSIEALRGVVEVDTRPGKGTTMTLKLPLTLAIIDGFLVEIGEVFYVIPLSSVEECLELARAQADKAQERGMINLRGEVVSYLSLRKYFAVEQAPPPYEQVVVTEACGIRIGFGVDRFVGQHQTVIKSLGKAYKGIREISGATILGDGSVALILDVQQLVESIQNTLSEAA